MALEEQMVVGIVQAIYYENPSNFYKVVRVEIIEDESDLLATDEIVMTGSFASLHLDTEYQFFGKLTNHPKYGEQFAVARYQQKAPTTEEGLVDYLSSSRFKGIGKVLAQRIVDTLGPDAIDVIISDSHALSKVNGLKKDKADNLREFLLHYQGTERIFMQLSDWGFGQQLADKIYRTYESNTLELIKENPYKLVEDIEGIGFHKADQLAERLGVDGENIDRVVAGIYVAVSDISMGEGDTYVEEVLAKDNARKLLEAARPYLISDDLLDQAIELAITNQQLMRLAGKLMLPSLYYAEVSIARRMGEFFIYEQIERFEEAEIDKAIHQVIELTGTQYDEIQQAAMKTAINSPMAVVTGGPGTGKTTLIKGIILLHSILHDYDLEEANKPFGNERPVLMAAPTGRAAKRMQETTGVNASTIHRLIGYNRETAGDNFVGDELDGKLLIIDEMSMVDTWLMNWLIQAVPYHLQVIFVGDKDQLPSVGPGKVFNDLIDSNVLPVLRLTIIYRQAQDSSIIKLAHEVREGRLPEDFLAKHADRSFIQAPSNQISSAIQQIVEVALRKGFDGNSLQVLAPMYKGPAGVNALNQLLQSLMNPPKKGKRELVHFESLYRVGDKVLQLVNNSEDGVYNGDIGRIEAIHFKNETESKVDELTVSFDGIELVYKRNDLDQLTLAYCTTIHKAQGSEYKLVLLPLVDIYSRLLKKDVLYTAITRAQSSLIMLGNPNSFLKAVTNQTRPRNTFLGELLRVQFDKDDDIERLGDPSSEDKQSDDKVVSTVINDVVSEDELGPVVEEKTNVLTLKTVMTLDPMIGMEGVTPYDFMD